MADLLTHKLDCISRLNHPFSRVHVWLDHYATFGVYEHRAKRHHQEGIEEVRRRFGEEAGRAAWLHIMRDCWHIPTRQDYETERVDNFGTMSQTCPQAVRIDLPELPDARRQLIVIMHKQKAMAFLWISRQDNRLSLRYTDFWLKNYSDSSFAAAFPLAPVTYDITPEQWRFFRTLLPERIRNQPAAGREVYEFGVLKSLKDRHADKGLIFLSLKETIKELNVEARRSATAD